MKFIERFALKNKNALITGANKGIGFEICKVLSDAGANIAASGRNQEDLKTI